MSDDREHIHITGVEVKNFRRLTIARVKYVPERGLVRVTGPNAAGKTSLLKAVAGALGGAGEIHEDSIHEDAETGEVKLTLSNGYTIERRHTPKNPKGYLHIVSPDGGKYGQSKLDEWVGPRSFQPLGFIHLSAEEKRDALFAVAEDPELPEKLDRIREEYDETYAERTPVISELRRLRGTEKPEGERPEPIDTTEEMQRLRELQAAERERNDLRQQAADARKFVSVKEQAIEKEKQTIEDLKRQLEEAKERLTHKETRRAEAQERAEKLEQELKNTPDPSDDMEAVQQRLERAQQVQDELEPWKRWEEDQARIEELEPQRAALTERLDKLESRRYELISEAGIPVDGLSFSPDGEPLLNERSLELASGGEKIGVAVAVAMAYGPDLRVCLLDEANDLSPASLQTLHELSVEHDFQIWACRLGLEGDGEIVVDDGKAWGADEERPVEPIDE